MIYGKVFKSGHSQAIRIPKAFQFHSAEVEIIQKKDGLLIREKPQNLERAFIVLTKMPKDFFDAERKDLPPQEREDF